MLDLDEDNELPPEAFEWLIPPKEGRQHALSNTERTRKKRRFALLLADADLYNELLAKYGRHVLDRLIEEGITARAFLCAVMLIEEDLDLWLEPTGERLVFRNLGAAERLGLECWLWETHDRQRQEWRYKPDRRLHHRPDQELIAHSSKQLWHGLHDFAGLVGDRYRNVWPGIAAICEMRKRQSRAQRTTRDARVRNLLFKDGKRRLTITAWPASGVRALSPACYATRDCARPGNGDGHLLTRGQRRRCRRSLSDPYANIRRVSVCAPCSSDITILHGRMVFDGRQSSPTSARVLGRFAMSRRTVKPFPPHAGDLPHCGAYGVSDCPTMTTWTCLPRARPLR
jgi:hypothetical protein